ncbi:hypothetical protein ACHAW5_008975 [Stephanodiscus triporus]|uniref:CBS domain-containing protein n=1 Tax=Stephanodiscus triporus TaxID=2934178 RepID=A0ABD3NB66_9STRA
MHNFYAAPPAVVKTQFKTPLHDSTNTNLISACSQARIQASSKAPMISTSDSRCFPLPESCKQEGDAAIITNSAGELAGIITDTDVTRRVVAKNLLASKTCVADVMTSNPSYPATDALMTMVENQFRHLLSLTLSGTVVGVGYCEIKEKSSNAAEEALNATLGGAGGAQAATLRQLLGPLMSPSIWWPILAYPPYCLGLQTVNHCFAVDNDPRDRAQDGGSSQGCVEW